MATTLREEMEDEYLSILRSGEPGSRNCRAPGQQWPVRWIE